MDSLKRKFFILPEIALLVLVLYFWISTARVLNYWAIGLFLIVIGQIVFQFRFIGLILASLSILISMYFILALFSEFREFAEFTDDARNLLVVGIPIWLLSMSLSFIMLYKYAIKPSLLTPLNMALPLKQDTRLGK